MKYRKALNQLNKLVEAFKSGEIGPIVEYNAIPSLDVPCSKWSLQNRILVALAGTSDARGYRQWREVGRHVKKGAKAIYILVPRLVKEEDEETGEERVVLKGFLERPVFRVEDTEGEPLEYQKFEPPEPPPLIDVAERYGISVKYEVFLGGYYGDYSPTSKEIRLRVKDAKVFFHELAHAAHDRIIGGLKGGQHPRQEAVAELVATVLARLYGWDYSGNCWEYIKYYAKGKDPIQLCLSVLSDCEKVLKEILDLKPEPEEVIA